jgi:hypothetical protein
MISAAHVHVNCRVIQISASLHGSVSASIPIDHLRGVAYMADTPAKKSRANPLPPVADAE